MTVKEILILACEFIGEKELAGKISSSEDLNDAENAKLQTLLSCFNLVNQEIASDYLPFLKREEVQVVDGKIFFSALSEQVVNVYEVKSKFGFSLSFKNFPSFIEVDGSAKTIVYSYIPEDMELTDTVEFFNGLSARVYAYGIASEFLLVSGVSDDAEIWEERFKESLFVLSRKRGEHRLPKRSFL